MGTDGDAQPHLYLPSSSRVSPYAGTLSPLTMISSGTLRSFPVDGSMNPTLAREHIVVSWQGLWARMQQGAGGCARRTVGVTIGVPALNDETIGPLDRHAVVELALLEKEKGAGSNNPSPAVSSQ